jgi:hypothetical protein
MDERLVNLLKGINGALAEFLVTVEKIAAAPADPVVVAPTAESDVPEVQAAPEEVTPTTVDKSFDVIVDPIPGPPPFEPEINILPDPEPMPIAEVMQDPVPPPSGAPAVPPSVFPLTVSQIGLAKRKDLRALVNSTGISIVGPNGEGPDELLVDPLRVALIKYVEDNVDPGVDVSATSEVVPGADSGADSDSEVAPDVVADVVVVAATADVPVDDVTVDEVPVDEVTSTPQVSKAGLMFESWVSDQAGGIVAGGTEVTTTRARELSEFFASNLPYVQGTDRDPLDSYFEKMGCNAKCDACPNGNMQPMYCYGVFDEEVTHISLNDAVNKDQFFLISETDGQIEYTHSPS